MIINSGIKRVVFDDSYPDSLSKEMFDEAEVTLINIRDIRDAEKKPI